MKQLFIQFINYVCISYMFRHYIAILMERSYCILSTAPQLSISQKALETLPEDGNVIPKHVGATIYNS
jgi:hypothetical protein